MADTEQGGPTDLRGIRVHVYLIQPTSPPVEAYLLELLLLADACRRAGAAQLTAVIPYFGYVRQDRRASGLSRIVAVDLRTAALEGVFTMPREHLSAVPLLAEAVRPGLAPNGVLVAPDLGAVKRAERYAGLLHLPVAIVHKTRISGAEVRVRGITGEVQGRVPLLVDDMISTGGTIREAVTALLAAGCVPEITVVARQGLFVGPAGERLRAVPLRRIVVTDSVAAPRGQGWPLEVVSLSPLLAPAIARLHDDKALGDLQVRE
jgi:ribose-phosphate pyrophosphokinase